MRARSTAVVEADDRGRREAAGAAALRRLQVHQDCAEALGERVVNVACDPVSLLQHGLASRLEQALIDQAAVIQRERRLLRGRVEQCVTPAPLALGVSDTRQRNPAERLRRQSKGSHQQRLHVRRTIECAHRLGQPVIVSVVFQDRVVALLGVAQMPAHTLALKVQRRPAFAVGGERLAGDVRHPQVALAARLINQPHTARV